MRYLVTVLLLVCVGFKALAQDDGPKEVTPQMLQSIKTNIEKQVVAFKQKYKDMSPQALEFMADTFRLEQKYKKVMSIDFSTVGMVNATGVRTNEYDRLLNKYYAFLMKLLKPEDKKALIDAQRAWIAFRDNESKLIDTLSKEVYSGGGTLQNIAIADEYSQLVSKRAITIAEYYISIAEEK